MAPNSKTVWRPKNCQACYATFYKFDQEYVPKTDQSKKTKPVEKPKPIEQVKEEPLSGKWCPACMKIALEPVTLSCGHIFCRRCFANIRHYLVQDYPEEIKDRRAVLKCPLFGCKNVVPCLPLLNGDFRFWAIRPSDKVQMGSNEAPLCEVMALTNYAIDVDVDLSIKSSSSDSNSQQGQPTHSTKVVFAGQHGQSKWRPTHPEHTLMYCVKAYV